VGLVVVELVVKPKDFSNSLTRSKVGISKAARPGSGGRLLNLRVASRAAGGGAEVGWANNKSGAEREAG
jgi:hypothetical protein